MGYVSGVRKFNAWFDNAVVKVAPDVAITQLTVGPLSSKCHFNLQRLSRLLCPYLEPVLRKSFKELLQLLNIVNNILAH